MMIKEVVEQTGLSRHTIRFYEKEKLIAPPERSGNGYRHYGKDIVQQLRLITRAKMLGFTLKEIKELSGLLYAKGLTEAELAKQLRAKKAEIAKKQAELKAIDEDIDRALAGLCEYRDQLDLSK